MRIFKKILAIMLACVSFTAVACGGGNNGGGDTDTVTIKVGDLITDTAGTNVYILNRQKKFDREHPNIKVEHVANPVSDATRTTQQIMQNFNVKDEACTILSTTAANYSRSLYQMGIIDDWSNYLTTEQKTQYRQEVVDSLTSSSGALTGFPTTLETPLIGFNRAHLRSEFVRKAILGDAHYNDSDAMMQIETILDNIATWEEYYNIVAKLTGTYMVNSKNVNVSGYAGYYTDYYLGFGVWFIANGYGLVTQNADGTIDVDLNDESSVEAIEFLQKMYADGITKTNESIGFNEFYNEIFAYKVASFIYYPTWASWFQSKALPASEIKVINIPEGPTVQRKKANGEKTPNTNPSFCINYVLNKNATAEQKSAAAEYLLYMYGSEAYEEKIAYQLENDIESFLLPPTMFTDDYLKETILSTAPSDWENAIVNAVHNLYVLECDTDGWRTLINGDMPSLIKKDTTYTGEALTNRLNNLNNRIYNEFLTEYNERHKK